jgi:hypothetical protein
MDRYSPTEEGAISDAIAAVEEAEAEEAFRRDAYLNRLGLNQPSAVVIAYPI